MALKKSITISGDARRIRWRDRLLTRTSSDNWNLNVTADAVTGNKEIL
jgi:hypothetical protein